MGDEILERVRAIGPDLPEVIERLSHGAPTFFVGGKKTCTRVSRSASIAPTMIGQGSSCARWPLRSSFDRSASPERASPIGEIDRRASRSMR